MNMAFEQSQVIWIRTILDSMILQCKFQVTPLSENARFRSCILKAFEVFNVVESVGRITARGPVEGARPARRPAVHRRL
jgi:hypothetical protein